MDVCQSPNQLAGQSLADIPASDLEVCQGDGDDDRANTVLLVLRSVEDKVSSKSSILFDQTGHPCHLTRFVLVS